MEDRSVEVMAVAIAFFALCWAAVLLRVYCRAFVLRSLGADDSLMVVSLVTLKLIYASQLLYVITVCLVKISVGFFLLRISVKTLHVMAIRALMVVTLLYGTAYLFLLAFQCAPVSTFWNESPRAPGRCLDQGLLLALTYTASAVNAAADWAFGVLPFFIVWSLSLPLRTRALAVGILSLAAVGSAATIVRAVYIPRLVAADDFLWSTADVALWSTVEPGVGIIAASIATLRPLWEIICGRSGLPSDASRSPGGGGGGGVVGPRSRYDQQRVASAADDYDDSRPSQSLDVPRSHFSSPSSPEERGADAGLWGGRHSRPRVPTLTLSWLFSPLGSRIANGGGGVGGERSTMGTHGGGWRPGGGGKSRFWLDDGDGGDEGNWRLTGMTSLAGPARDRHAMPTPAPPLPPLPALTRLPILQHQAAALGLHHGFHAEEVDDDGGHKNAFISSYGSHNRDHDHDHINSIQPLPPLPLPPMAAAAAAGRSTVGSFPTTRPDTMATVGTTDSHPAPQLLNVQASRQPLPPGHAYRHEGARTRSHAGEIDDSFVIPPHWKRDTFHSPMAAGGGLQPVESNEEERTHEHEHEYEHEHEHEHEQQQYGYEQHHQQQPPPPQYDYDDQRRPSSDSGQGGTWMLVSQPSQLQSLQPWTTESSSIWGAQTAQLQHQLPLPHPHSPQAQYGTATTAADDDDGYAPSECSEAPRLNWSTPRVSAISFGGWGGAGGTAPRSEGAASRSSVAAAAAAAVGRRGWHGAGVGSHDQRHGGQRRFGEQHGYQDPGQEEEGGEDGA
ncbi:hypothetical protein RB594_008363 [Gaeumannomyces avenae]